MNWKKVANLCFIFGISVSEIYSSCEHIQDLTPVRGLDWKSQGKIAGLQQGSAELENSRNISRGCLRLFRLSSHWCLIRFLTNILLKVYHFPSWDTPYMTYDVTHILTSPMNDVKGTEKDIKNTNRNENIRHTYILNRLIARLLTKRNKVVMLDIYLIA